MIAFLIGFLISAFAAVPPLLMVVRKRGSEFKIRMKLWVIGSAIRFAILGIFLLLLFKLTDIHRVSVIAGVLVAYFVGFAIEIYLANRQVKSE